MKNMQDTINFTNTKRILYVEDEADLRSVTASILSDIFLEVIIAKDGEDALEKFYTHEIDVVLTDLSMPKMNGFDMAKRIKDFDADIPIIMISAHDESEYFTQSIELGVDGYLLKPMKLDDLIATFKKIINKIQFLNEYHNNLRFLKQYQDLTDLHSLVSKTDTKGVLTYVNDAFCKVSGYTRDELIGSSHNIVRHPDNPASMYADLWHTIKFKKEIWKGILRNISKKNEIYYSNAVISPITNIDNEIVEYISIKYDVTDIIDPKKQLHDFVDSAKEPMIVMIEIDGFSDLETLYGHKLTQSIEKTFAKDLVKYMPSYLGFNKLYPLGNGKYAFVKDLVLQNDLAMKDLIQELKSFQFIINDLKVDVGEIDYDIAIVMSVADGDNCLENVDYGINSLSKLKQDFIISNNFAQKEHEKALENLEILRMVKIALDNSKIISYFQPIVCNTTQKIVKYESLVRLVNEQNKIIPPFFFLDIAKKGKYYSRITAMVLENSFDALEKTDKDITVNISALDIEKLSTRTKIFQLLNTHRKSASRVVFELLEDENVKDFDEIERFISKVKEYGVKIAIDDFGAGYSNFERLLKYQPDILKIDGSLIKNIETDSYSISVVKSIVAFAKEQKIEMVAEYIENENIYTILKDLGVEYSQGYYFGKPDKIGSH